jgi:uncharacterized protein (DUF433 family)
MIVKVFDQHIEITPGMAGGKPCIAGHRITVHDIAVWHERMGLSADEIAVEYNLTLGDIYAALAYYFDHREEVDRQIAEDGLFAETLRQQSPSLVKQKLLRLQEGGGQEGEE